MTANNPQPNKPTLDETLGLIKYDTIDGLFPLDPYYTREAYLAIASAIGAIIHTTCAWNGMPAELETFNKLRAAQYEALTAYLNQKQEKE